MAKFFFFEYIVNLFYTHVFTAPKSSYSKTTQLGVTFASGYAAGVVCAIVSHPADSVVSLMGKAEHKGKSIGAIASEVGFANLATKGLGTRVLMIGTLTGTLPSTNRMHALQLNHVPQASSGGSTTASRPPWVWVPLAASRCPRGGGGSSVVGLLRSRSRFRYLSSMCNRLYADIPSTRTAFATIGVPRVKCWVMTRLKLRFEGSLAGRTKFA